MKRYLNYIRFFSVMLITGVAIAACSSSDDIVKEEPQQPTGPKTYTMTVQASKGGEGTRALTPDGSTLNATWAAGEAVTVYNVTKGADLEGTLVAQSSGVSTTLKGNLTGTIEDGDKLQLKFCSPDYENQNGTLEYIASHCDYAEANVTATVSGTSVTTGNANFVNQQAIVKFTLKQKADGSNVNIPASTALTVNDGTNDYTITPTSATNVLFVAIPPTGTVNLSTTVGGISYSYNKTGANLVAGSYYDISVKMNRDLVNLTNVTENTTLFDGDVVTGTLGVNKKISIADGAAVTLNGVTINGTNDGSYRWAGLTCLGDATINLADGTTNTVKGFYHSYPGIQAAKRAGEGKEYTLTIQGTGTLDASSNGYGAGIGGGSSISCGNITINSGTVIATGADAAAGIGAGRSTSCGNITISGGTVTATGGNGNYVGAAGIGGGTYGSSTCGVISISGGTITATGGYNAPGIGCGSGSTCEAITISGGKVTAKGGSGGTGIGNGAGSGSNCGDIEISGGTVTATGGYDSAGIGSGVNRTICGDIKISGGSVTAQGGGYGAGIGSGYNNSSCGAIEISGGTVEATGGSYASGIGMGTSESSCGTITIQNTVTRVTATKGSNATNSIGKAYNGTCGTVTIGGTVYPDGISTSPYTYQP